MQWFKYSLVLLLISQSLYAQKFTSKECLVSSYETVIKNDGKFFGLIKNNLVITKRECEISISYKNILETTWKIDICREPIHIKLNSKGTQTVHKRTAKCEDKSDSDYCQYWAELREVLQDYGLIYAQGEREQLSTSHGQTYCSFLLLNEYLGEGQLFSKYEKPKNLFSMSSSESCDLNVETTKPKSHVKGKIVAPEKVVEDINTPNQIEIESKPTPETATTQEATF